MQTLLALPMFVLQFLLKAIKGIYDSLTGQSSTGIKP